MLSAGEITIQMQAQSSHFKTTIASTRPQFVSKLFTGKPISQMLDAVPLLFNICRAAQSVASVRASEQALGLITPELIEHYRERLVRFEMLHEHLWKLLIDLPMQLGLSPWQKPMVLASQQLQPLLRHMQLSSCRLSTQLKTWKETLPELDAEFCRTLQSLLFGHCNRPQTRDTLLQNDAVAGQLLRALQSVDFFGVVSWSQQAPIDKQRLYEALTEQTLVMEREFFSEDAPIIDNGPLARMQNHVWLQTDSKAVLVPRLLSILAETDALLNDGKFALAELGHTIPGFGISEVETARGRLHHMVMVDDKKTVEPVLTQMHVIAPTDWHFHTNGIAAKSVSFIPNELALTRKRAELVVKLINPCVGYNINIEKPRQEAPTYA